MKAILASIVYAAVVTMAVVSGATAAELKLLPFDPAGTSKTTVVELTDSHRAVRTVDLVLHGSGFPEDPSSLELILDGRPTRVSWTDGCEPSASAATARTGCNEPGLSDAALSVAGQDDLVIGRRVSGEQIHLCRVPVQGCQVAVELRHGTVATGARTFRIDQSMQMVAFLALVVTAILSALVVGLIKVFKANQGSQPYNALKVMLLDPETDTYSLSKFQFYCWTAAALFGYSYLVISRMIVQGQRWPDIPDSLPGIIAVGTGTAIGAVFATNVRGPKGAGAEEPSLGDLVTTGGVAAPERIQMFVWTLLGIGIFCTAALKHSPSEIITLDAVPTQLLYMMGLSSAGYLAGKLARKPGPIISEISITPAESDDDIAASTPKEVPLVQRPLAEAQRVADGLPAVDTFNGQTAVQDLRDAIAIVSEIRTTADGKLALDRLAAVDDQVAATAIRAASEFEQLPDVRTQSAETLRLRVAADVAQSAASAVHQLREDLVAVMTAAATPNTPRFTRVIELRGRNLSSAALLEIDGTELSFRMLRADAGNLRVPEIVIRESDNPEMAQVMRLSIDPDQLEAPDLQLYRRWFGASSPDKKKFTLINPDGQRADLSFSIPPGAAQSVAGTS